MPRRPRSFEFETWEVMSTKGVGRSAPFWYTRTTPPFSVMNIRPSGAKAIPVANGRLLATTSSTNPDGVNVIVASEGAGRPTIAMAASTARPHARRRLRPPPHAHQVEDSDSTLISYFLSFTTDSPTASDGPRAGHAEPPPILLRDASNPDAGSPRGPGSPIRRVPSPERPAEDHVVEPQGLRRAAKLVPAKALLNG